uniref:Uncharacterized protein n=1 Tax=Avena sativa TaxID=4498 RepID=A0ACD5ZSB5_AVESA
MGNCLNTASKQQEALRRRGERVVPEEARSIGEVLLHDDEEEEDETPAATSTATAAAGMKVKVVLTRAELEWLMAQLKSGEQRLEDVLRQMSTARTGAAPDNDGSKPSPRAVDGWRPRLERILECPEPVDAT